MTGGGDPVTSGGGGSKRAFLYAYAGFGAVALLAAIVNALSEIDDRAKLGRPVPSWEPWTWELTSFAGWVLVLPLILAAAARFRPPRLRLPAALAMHALMTVPVSLAHVGIMIGLRELIYRVAGDEYEGAGSVFDVLVYEYRKDLLTYAAVAVTFLAVERMLRRPEPAAAAAGEPLRLEVRDGGRTVWLAPEDVEWAQSAGNYVELHGRFGTLLHRETLAALEERLGPHGFRRIHRSRLVRTAAVRSVATRPSGDFDVTLGSGECLAGSRRFRDRLTA